MAHIAGFFFVFCKSLSIVTGNNQKLLTIFSIYATLKRRSLKTKGLFSKNTLCGGRREKNDLLLEYFSHPSSRYGGSGVIFGIAVSFGRGNNGYALTCAYPFFVSFVGAV